MNHQDEFTNPRTEQMWPDVCVLLLMLEFIAHGEYCLHSVCVRFCVRVSVCVAVHSVSEAHAWSRLDRDLRTGCPIVVKFVRCVVSSCDPLL